MAVGFLFVLKRHLTASVIFLSASLFRHNPIQFRLMHSKKRARGFSFKRKITTNSQRYGSISLENNQNDALNAQRSNNAVGALTLFTFLLE